MKSKRILFVSIGLFFAFVLWTILVRFVDVKAIGPEGSYVGFASMNVFFHKKTGVNMWIYTMTDWLGLVPIAVAFGFAVLGLIQLIKRKKFFSVDRSILALGGFYIVVMVAYAFFEFIVVNYRPVMIDGYLESSYPSSTTMLVACVMPTAIMQLWTRIKPKIPRFVVIFAIVAFTAFMVIGRLISGVHWLSDIIGGILLSASFVTAYRYFA